MKPETNDIGLSRRKMLLGLGAVGVASAGAGLGTTAYFNDTETFANNSLTAGTLDMSVTATVEAADDYWSSEGVVGISETADGEGVTAGLVVDDVKPGDWAIICFDIEVGDNPGYVQVRMEDTQGGMGLLEEGGANPEPEQAVEGDADNDADLGAFLLASVWQNYDASTGDRSGLSVLDPVFNNAPNATANAASINYGTPDVDGVVPDDPVVAHYTNAREAAGQLGNGYLIKDDNGDLLAINDTESEGVYSFCLLLEVPHEVGNVIQGDSLAFDLIFETEQVRHNEDPFNNSAPVNTTAN
jgi:predicted ribosomally synthesized peptide with SipW-like signal peptide